MTSDSPAPNGGRRPGTYQYVKPSFPTDAFAGTASYYLRYRLPYPDKLLADLAARSRITGKGRLIDLACGPGRLALALASSFSEIWAIDIEPEMIEIGKAEGARRGVKNIRWITGRVEDLEAPFASFELITAGEAFHRLDQQRVAAQAHGWLKPAGALATMGCYSILSGREAWQRIVLEVVGRHTGRPPEKCGPGVPDKPGIGPEHDQWVMEEAGFEDVGSHPFVEAHAWTLEAILGYLYSTSLCSKRVLGDKAGAFEEELRSALLAHDSGGVYREHIQWGYTFGRKPGRD
jgi:ubiquinone/menaquinone biosynthesis C-methylase UbiE